MNRETTDNTSETPEQFCSRLIVAFTKKADHNKSESLVFFIIIIAATLSAPLFVTLGTISLIAKVIPSILSLLAAGSTAWLQLRRPQGLWTLYRSIQRELEDVQKRYEFQVGEFETAPDSKKLFASKVTDLALAAHHQWLPLAPSTEHLDTIVNKTPNVTKRK